MPVQKKKKMNIRISLRASLMVLGVAGMFTVLPPAVSHAEYNGTSESAAGAMAGLGDLLTKISLRTALGAGKVSGVTFYDEQAMADFYASVDHKTFWIHDDGLRPEVSDIYKILEASWTHGLNPEAYHVSELRELLSRDALTDRARVELLLTDGVIRYMRDQSGMRVNAASIRQESQYWQQPQEIKTIYSGLANAGDVVEYVQSTTPKGHLYDRLRSELVRLSQEDGDYDYVLPLDFNDRYFKPGEKHDTVRKLRVRLGEKHDPQRGPEDYYDDELASVVMALQHEHGLDADGVIGPQTLNVLNQSNKKRMRQIVANLERTRWLDRDRPDRYVLVNIASQTLWGIDEGKVALEIPVIVGSTYRKTMMFKTEIQGVRFNPDWTVPLSIKVKDFLPKLRKGGPDYLDYKGIEVIRGYGDNARTLDPYSIDWDNVGWREMSKFRMVQTPGDHNALGRIRILMPNKYNIYLHDTNHPELFSRNQRTLSSGCIRLSDPKAVARFVLNKNKKWGEADMRNVLSTTQLTEVQAASRMPIYIIYQSVWLDDNDQLVFGSDVYKRDKKLLEVLEAMNAYYIPDRGDSRYAALGKDGKAFTKLASNSISE